ncbi:40S ribosomal protein S12 [Capsicum annuum]|nr:40S ribosomal protein S12 [Capsicum annuum]
MTRTRKSCPVYHSQKKKCGTKCKFRNHLPPQKDETYKNIEQVFGLANFERFYDRVEPQWRDALIDSYAYEANERIKDPIHGITKDITLLQQRLANTKRLGTANVLVSGLAGCTVEFCKHIVVAGVKSLTLNDDRMITQDLLYGNSLIKPNEEFHRDKTIAQRLFGQDLKSIMEFCSFEEAIAVPWKTLPKGVSEIFLAMRVAENFEATHRRNVGKLSATDFQNLKTFKDVLCDKQRFLYLIYIPFNCRDDVVVAVAETPAPALEEPMDIMTALQLMLRKSRANGGLFRELNEGAKVIENHAAQLCVLSKGL